MTQIHILVEGQTEQEFVDAVIVPLLATRNVFARASTIKTKRTKVGPDFKGGITSFQKLKNELERLLHSSHFTAVTTFIDFYGLEKADFPGWGQMHGDCYQKVKYLEKAFAQAVNNRRFIPHLMLHEFETMLFVSVEAIQKNIPDADTAAIQQLTTQRSQFNSVEEINLTAPPSKRIQEQVNYRKGVDGALIALDIGIENIRAACQHFDTWLQKLESLGSETST